ncbi:hypothetical protein ACX6XY_15770 [Streptomyces sp. O3]
MHIIGIRRTTAIAATATATVAAAWAGAAPAAATTIIGTGNGAHDNTCLNLDGRAVADGPTTDGVGTLGGLIATLPLSGPANQCGNLGLQAADSEDTEDDGGSARAVADHEVY